jgi:hypothetical protein
LDNISCLIIGEAATSVGHYRGLLLWSIFWVIACSVIVALIVTVVTPLRLGLSRAIKGHPRPSAFVLPICFSLYSTYLLAIWIFSSSNAKLSMLIDGQIRVVFGLVFFPHGQLSIHAIMVFAAWAGFQLAAIRIAWWLSPRRKRPRTPAPAKISHWPLSLRRYRRFYFLLFFSAAFASALFLAVRLYPAQRRFDHDMAINEASLIRLSKAQGEINALVARHSSAGELLAAGKRAEKLAAASASIGRRLQAAKQERDRRLSRLVDATVLVLAICLLFFARRMQGLLSGVVRGKRGGVA